MPPVSFNPVPVVYGRYIQKYIQKGQDRLQVDYSKFFVRKFAMLKSCGWVIYRNATEKDQIYHPASKDSTQSYAIWIQPSAYGFNPVHNYGFNPVGIQVPVVVIM